MGYYTISISSCIQYMTTIVNEFGKFRYNQLPMGMYTFGYILQYKIDELLCNTKGVKIYTDDILYLIKEIFYNNIDRLRVIISRLYAVGLKVNATKCLIWLK